MLSRYTWKSTMLMALTDKAIKVLVEQVPTQPSAYPNPTPIVESQPITLTFGR